MRFTVKWSADAENELAALWMNPALRAGVTTASQALDQRLMQSAAEVGESREGRRRIAFEAPLAITFLVDQTSRIVTVTHVWAPRRRGS